MERPSLTAGLLLTALAAGCEDNSAPDPIVPSACMNAWIEDGSLVNNTLDLTPAPEDQVPPELEATIDDVHQLVGFQASFQASAGAYAVPSDTLNARISSGELVSLAYQGELPNVDTNRIWQGALYAP